MVYNNVADVFSLHNSRALRLFPTIRSHPTGPTTYLALYIYWVLFAPWQTLDPAGGLWRELFAVGRLSLEKTMLVTLQPAAGNIGQVYPGRAEDAPSQVSTLYTLWPTIDCQRRVDSSSHQSPCSMGLVPF